MKKLLSLVAMLALAAACVPHVATAGLRGAFDPITFGPNYATGIPNGMQTPAARPGAVWSNGGVSGIEQFITFTTRSQALGNESSREIWLGVNFSQGGFFFDPSDTRLPLLRDETGTISYSDPSWSPDGRFLAYVKSDHTALQSSILVQEFQVSSVIADAVTPVGAPILVVPEVPLVAARHPNWSPDGTTLVYDSNATGLSIDLYKIQVFPTVGSPVRLTFVDNRAEQNPAWAPDGVRIAFDTNQFGPNVIEILDTSTNTTTLAEQNFKPVSHSYPRWTTDGASIFYYAPQAEDAQQNTDIWKLDLATQAKCDILFDGNGDLNADVSRIVHNTADHVPYNQIYFESQAAGFGLIIWRANALTSCLAPLPMAIAASPTTLNLGSSGQNLTFTITFPAETQAAGYQAQTFNGPREGVKNRRTIVRSPLFLGLAPRVDPVNGSPFSDIKDVVQGGEQAMVCYFDRRTIEARLVALGLVNQQVPINGSAYSNNTGRAFAGITFLGISANNLAGSAVRLEQNSPNPFNPVTKIRFATSKAGNVALRVYNVSGQLVKTLADRNFEAGAHEITWDGKNSAGLQTSSGVYYAKVSAGGGATDVIKMVMAK